MSGIRPGEYISKDLSELLSKHTTLKDAANIEAETNISSSLILKIKNGTSKVTQGNLKAVDKLIRIAYENIQNSEKETRKHKRTILSILDCI